MMLLAAWICALPFAPVQDPTDEVIEELVEALGSDYLDEREEAKKKLVAIGDRAIPFVSKSLRDGDSRILLAAVDILRELKDTSHVGAVGKLFDNAADEETLIKSFDYLKSAGASAEDYLIKALKRRGDYFRVGALQKLREIGSKKAAPTAYQMYTTEEDPKIRRMAFDLIKDLKLEAKDLLVKFLADEQDESIRREALQSLQGSYEDDVLAAVGAMLRKELQDSVVNQAFSFLQGAAPARIEQLLIGALEGNSMLTRRKAIGMLAEIRSAKALDRVLDAAQKTQDREVKLECIKYFATFPEKTEAYLLRLLEDPDAEIRRKVIKDLSAGKRRVGFDKIREILDKDGDLQTRQEAFRFFVAIGADAREILIRALGDSDDTIRMEAVDALGEFKIAAAILPLVKVLRNESDKARKDRVVNALGKIGLDAIAAIERAAKEDAALVPILTVVREVFDESQVEGVLGGSISINELTHEETTGSYPGQFDALKSLGIEMARVVEALRRIQEEAYEPRTARMRGLANRDLLRRNAVLALGRVGGRDAQSFLRKRYEELAKLEYHEVLIEDVVVSLAHLGDREPASKLIAKLSEEARKEEKDDPNGAYSKLFSINVIRNRIGDRDGALKGYLDLDEAMQKNKERDAALHANTLYNLACVYSLKGSKAEAVRTLRRAVETGFRDKGWIQKDAELDSIRDAPGYRELLDDPALFRGQ
jgi:HEAT repeat protein